MPLAEIVEPLIVPPGAVKKFIQCFLSASRDHAETRVWEPENTSSE